MISLAKQISFITFNTPKPNLTLYSEQYKAE